MLHSDPKHLRDCVGLAPWLAKRLAGFGFFDSAQLLGAVAVEGMEDRLAEGLGVDRGALAEAIAATRREADWDAFNPANVPCEERSFGARAPTPAAEAEIDALQTPLQAPAVVPPAVNRIAELPALCGHAQNSASIAVAVSTVYAHHCSRNGDAEPLSDQLIRRHAMRVEDGDSGQLRALQTLVGASARCAPLVLAANDVRGAKNALASGRLMSVTIPVYASWARNEGVRQTGRITMRLGEEPVIGGQALCIVGYQDKADYPGGGYFVVRNSLGPNWAYASPFGPGYGTIPYAYIAREGWELAGVA
ncbi:hypothetical protein [Phenylobacterium immobile]|uniref:hypothetical protein n=1 Tax=Phenylobacterium immobile TaxID=21 RepID=UPI000A7DEC2C|nr:hypothetical protein [Phenylobacterium immobile]